MAGEPTMCHALCLHCFLLFLLTAPRGTHCLTDEDTGSERGDRQEGHPCWCSGDYKTHARRCVAAFGLSARKCVFKLNPQDERGLVEVQGADGAGKRHRGGEGRMKDSWQPELWRH